MVDKVRADGGSSPKVEKDIDWSQYHDEAKAMAESAGLTPEGIDMYTLDLEKFPDKENWELIEYIHRNCAGFRYKYTKIPNDVLTLNTLVSRTETNGGLESRINELYPLDKGLQEEFIDDDISPMIDAQRLGIGDYSFAGVITRNEHNNKTAIANVIDDEMWFMVQLRINDLAFLNEKDPEHNSLPVPVEKETVEKAIRYVHDKYKDNIDEFDDFKYKTVYL